MLLTVSPGPEAPVCPELLALTADGDVRLICSGGTAVRAHRLMLSLASPVLRDALATSATSSVACASATMAVDGAPLGLPCPDDPAWVWQKRCSRFCTPSRRTSGSAGRASTP